MKLTNYLIGLCLILVLPIFAQQNTDTAIEVSVNNPRYKKAEGPTILIDGGHHNFHTYEGRFNPFARLLEADGYQVEGAIEKFTNKLLKQYDILVISNPLNEVNRNGNWILPNPSAFTPKEIKCVAKWVKQGGRLLLIADHMPFPGGAGGLATAFGFTFSNGFALPLESSFPTTTFTLANGTLHENELTKGHKKEEVVTEVATFTGSAFQIPATATPILSFPADHSSLEPDTAWRFHPTTKEIALEHDWYQGAYMPYGKGKIVVYGEAAMMTAQIAGAQRRKIGFNHPQASQNIQFILNTIHWLDK